MQVDTSWSQVNCICVKFTAFLRLAWTVASRLANPFGHPSQVRTQVLVLQTCVDLRRLASPFGQGISQTSALHNVTIKAKEKFNLAVFEDRPAGFYCTRSQTNTDIAGPQSRSAYIGTFWSRKLKSCSITSELLTCTLVSVAMVTRLAHALEPPGVSDWSTECVFMTVMLARGTVVTSWEKGEKCNLYQCY